MFQTVRICLSVNTLIDVRFGGLFDPFPGRRGWWYIAVSKIQVFAFAVLLNRLQPWLRLAYCSFPVLWAKPSRFHVFSLFGYGMPSVGMICSMIPAPSLKELFVIGSIICASVACFSNTQCESVHLSLKTCDLLPLNVDYHAYATKRASCSFLGLRQLLRASSVPALFLPLLALLSIGYNNVTLGLLISYCSGR